VCSLGGDQVNFSNGRIPTLSLVLLYTREEEIIDTVQYNILLWQSVSHNLTVLSVSCYIPQVGLVPRLQSKSWLLLIIQYHHCQKFEQAPSCQALRPCQYLVTLSDFVSLRGTADEPDSFGCTSHEVAVRSQNDKHNDQR
jgi:hypothetical protein